MFKNLVVAATLVGAMWLIFFVGQLFPNNTFESFGILPRCKEGLWGIICSPFIHGSFQHISSNSIPLLVLTFILMCVYPNLSFKVWTLSALVGGLLTWCFAREAYHIGASGVIFALATFILASGIFRKSFFSLIVAIVVFIIYGGILYGVLPQEKGISWEGHLFGAIAGVLLAWVYRHHPARAMTVRGPVDNEL